MLFGFVGEAYTARSGAVADEECINLYPEPLGAQSMFTRPQMYGGMSFQGRSSYFWTPGLKAFTTLAGSPVNDIFWTGTRCFAVGNGLLTEIFSDGSQVVRASIATDSNPASVATNGNQLLIVSANHAYCYNLADATLTEVTADLAGTPAKVVSGDTYFIVMFQNSRKFQISAALDGTSWPGGQVNEVSVFTENLTSIEMNHGELWVFGDLHAQVYQDTGSLEIYDTVGGALIEMGNIGAFGPAKLDNSIFWINEDERGARMCWRSNGYTPQRISTYGVEIDLASYTDLSGMTTYSYQDGGHLFWVIYIPNSQWSWVYDVTSGLWHKRSTWNTATATWSAHKSWNHVYAFNRHLVGDWGSGKIYTMSQNYFDDDGTTIRRVRRSPIIINEMERVYHADFTADFEMGNLSIVSPTDLSDFASALSAPTLGTSAADVNTASQPWTTPANAIVGPGTYTTNAPAAASFSVASVEAIDTKLGLPSGPEHYFVLVTFTTSAAAIGSNYTFSGLTTYTTLNGQTLQSISGGGTYLPTPASNQALFTFGTVTIPLQSNTPDTGTATIAASAYITDALDITNFGFSPASTTTPKGLMPSFVAYASVSGVSVYVQMLKGGTAQGNVVSLPIGTSAEIISFGDLAELFGVSWTYLDLAATNFGFRIWAQAPTAFTIHLGSAQLQIYTPNTTQAYSYNGPNPNLVDGNGNPRPPQAMLRWSDTRGFTWSNEHIVNCGNLGQYQARAIWRRLGQSRYRIYELSMSDPIPWVINDAYLRTA